MSEETLIAETLECSGCEETIPNGSQIYVLCAACAMAILNIPDPNQLTLFEIPPSSVIH